MTQTEPENSSGSCCLFFPPWSLFVSPHLHPSHYHHPSHHPTLGIGPILAVTQFQPYPLPSTPLLSAAHPCWRGKGGSCLKWMEGCRMSPPAAWGRRRRLPQQREGWEAGGSWDFLLGGVLPACPSPSAPPHLSYLAWEVQAPLSLWEQWFFQLPTSFVSHLRNSGSMFAGAGTPLVLLPSRPAPLHPVNDKLSRHEALQAHGGAQLTYFQRWLAASSHLVGSQALAPKPQCQDC